jgi:uncharacterized protein
MRSINIIYSRQNILWNSGDVFKVIAIILSCVVGIYISVFVTLGDRDSNYFIFEYVGSLLVGLVPYVWIKRKYLLRACDLGFRRGGYNLFYSVSCSIVSAITCSIVFDLLFKINHVPVRILEPDVSIFLVIILYPISIAGFAGIIFVPLSEEVFFRGFLYSFFRKKFGIVTGLIIQSIIFTFLHPGFILSKEADMLYLAFILGLVSGIFFEYTNSIYPSVVYHGIINYMLFILGVYPITAWFS